MMCAIMHMMAPCVLSCQARWQKRNKGPTVAVPDTQPQIVQGEIFIMEKGWDPDNQDKNNSQKNISGALFYDFSNVDTKVCHIVI